MDAHTGQWHGAGPAPALIAALLLAGCAVLAPSGDPALELEQARALWRDGQLAPAEKLIHESIDLARAQGNHLALGEGQLAYAQFLRSKGKPESVREEVRRHLREAEKAFLDAEPALRASADPFQLSNLWLRRGVVYEALDDRVRACGALREALAAYREGMVNQPGTTLQLPGYGSFEDYIKKERASLGCS